MKAMILAAGLGTRLRPFTDTLPKPLVPVGGRPLIVWNLLLLRSHGVREVMINLHHLADKIQDHLEDGRQWGMQLAYSRETALLGTGGGIKQVEEFFDGQPFLVLNGDTLEDLNLTEMIARHQDCGALATMALRSELDVENWGVVECNDDNRVLTIRGVGLKEDIATSFIHRKMFAGIHVLQPEVLRDIPKDSNSSIIAAYQACLEKGGWIQGYGFSGYWSDVGTLERYRQVERDFAMGLLPVWEENETSSLRYSSIKEIEK